MKKIIGIIFLFIFCFSLNAVSKEVQKDPFLIKVKPAKLNKMKKNVLSWFKSNKKELAEINYEIWKYAETAMKEFKSSELLASYLENKGFKVERGVAGMPTAFVATYGTGKPIIGILAEYDALAGLSQDTVPYKKPLEKGQPGHGCGHNLFGVASSAAAVAIKTVMEKEKLKGTIKLFGCPAEETVVGKVFMAREGVFNNLSCCLHWHPSSRNRVSLGSSNALKQFEVEFFGTTAHSAGDPWNGRSALDAIELTNVGLNYLREHLKPTARIHYVIQKGGEAPNVVPDYAKAWYYVRNIDWESVKKNYKRVIEIIEGASRMTGTDYKINYISGVHEVLPNRTGAKIMYSNLILVGAPDFSSNEQEFAEKIQNKLGIEENGLSTEVDQLKIPQRSWGSGSTDVAEVSWLTPTVGLNIASKPIGTPGHHWSIVACGGMSIGYKALSTAGKVMSFTAIDLLTDKSLIEQMRNEWKDKKGEIKYESPLTEDMKPPIVEEIKVEKRREK